MPHTTGPAIPEERVAAILARAAELDRDRRETIPVDAIRNAAMDAGISVAAVDTALAEYAAGAFALVPAGTKEEEQQQPPRFAAARALLAKGMRALRTPLKLGALLFVLGLTGAAGEAAFLIGFAGWLYFSARLIWKQRAVRKATPFVLALVYMSVGLALGFAAAEIDEDAIGVVLGMAIPMLALGTAVIKVRMPRRWRAARGEIGAAAS